MNAFDFALSRLQFAWHAIATFVVSKIICIPFLKRPFQQLQNPKHYGIENGIDIRIPVENQQELGAWFVRPQVVDSATDSAMKRWKTILDCNECSKFQSNTISSHMCDANGRMYLTDPNETMILYLHGNSESRSQRHRRELYKRWQSVGLPVLAIDYRGYADSDGGFFFQTSQTSMVWDGVMSFRLLKKYIHPSTKLVVWGHSLGTGVTSKLG